ncbi:hypothetical protein M407DRAFT_5078 [Tulasnella calospora MUT 4182]|uniref:Uncharacterized protein n=1 Tax=Tulasnella calospora MUT 4182 TaxID=1051891 RepID=A0A0C3MCI9_9AGAM|nr:hypothetical protein M407DRAFT_5078 [Tulasnella calospora MUT 4182]
MVAIRTPAVEQEDEPIHTGIVDPRDVSGTPKVAERGYSQKVRAPVGRIFCARLHNSILFAAVYHSEVGIDTLGFHVDSRGCRGVIMALRDKARGLGAGTPSLSRCLVSTCIFQLSADSLNSAHIARLRYLIMETSTSDALKLYKRLSEEWLEMLATTPLLPTRGSRHHAINGTTDKSSSLDSLRKALFGMKEIVRDPEYAWRMVISDGVELQALVAWVDDIKHDLRKVVRIYIPPVSDLRLTEIRNVSTKIKTRSKFTEMVIDQCKNEDKDIQNRWSQISPWKLRRDSERRKQEARTWTYWLKAIAFSMAVAAIAAFAASAHRASEYFAALFMVREFVGDRNLLLTTAPARAWGAENQEQLARNIHKVKKNNVSSSVMDILTLVKKPEENPSEVEPEEYFQNLLQRVEQLEQLFQEWALIHSTAVTGERNPEVTPNTS